MLRADAQFAAAEDAFRLCTGARAVAAGAAMEGGQGGDPHALQGASPTYIAYAHNEYGHLLTQVGRGKEAARQWRQAVAVHPQFAQGWVNVAGEAGLDESIDAYRNALRLQPSLIEAWINLAQVYYNNFRKNETYLDQALQTLARAREVAPLSTSALYSYVRTSVDLCRWHDWEASFSSVESAIKSDLERGSLLSSSISLVYLLIYPISDEILLSAYAAKAAAVRETARGVADTLSPAILNFRHLNFRHHVSSHSQTEAPRGEEVGGGASKGEDLAGRASKGKGCLETEVLVIGFVSADYREHPVSLLFQNVPRFHDTCQFRVVCFSLHSPPETAAGDRMRLLLRQNAHRFVDLDGLNLAQAAAAIAAEGVHVLVDMNGYTQNARPELFAIFSASDVLSVSLLGFASSLMAHASAALASDRITSPPEMLGSYSERLLYLPDSFYLADHSRSFHTRALNDPGALPAVSKAQVGHGMRQEAFVFGAFNQPFKFCPKVWALWMRLLKAVPNSQLWVVKLNEGAAAESSLRMEALRLGLCLFVCMYVYDIQVHTYIHTYIHAYIHTYIRITYIRMIHAHFF